MKRILSLALVTALLCTCLLTGLVLPVAAEPAAVAVNPNNLLTNGDFEQGTVGWESCAAMVKDGIGYGGSKGLAYDTHGYSSFATWQGSLALEPHSVYRVTYRYHGAPVCIYPAGTKTDVSDFGIKTATKDYGEWATRIVYFTTGANPVLSSVRFGRTTENTTGVTYIDDVCIEKFTESTDQIVGGDFESASVSWLEGLKDSVGFERVPDPLGSDNTVAHFTTDATNGASYYKYLRLVPARRYRLTFKHYGANLSYQFDKTVGMDTTGRTLGYWASTGVHSEWTTVTFEFDTFNQNVVTSNGAYQFCFGVANGAYIDDVSLVTIPSVTGLVLNATELSLRTGKKYQMTYTMTPADAPIPGGALSWSSDSPDVVSVTANGELFVRGNAGQSAIITLSNPCISASCVVTIPTNDPTVDAFFKKSGIGDYTVTARNFDKIIAAESAYAALTDVQKEYIGELLPVGRNYPDLLAKAKEKQSELATDWAKYYACDGAKEPYTAVDFNNCLWIAQAAEEWAVMSDSTKAIVNAFVQDGAGMTFDQMLADACALLPAREEAPEEGGNEEAPIEPEDTVEPGKIVSSGSTSITISNDWRDSVEIPEYAYSIAIVGDTQVVTERSPEGLKKLYDWIIDNVDDKNIQFVAGLGDITEHNTDEEWTVAAEQILRLNGVVPYSVVYGNHDVYNYSTAMFNKYLSVDAMFGHLSSDRYGLYEAGKTDNTYQLFEVGDVKYMMITLEFGPSHEVLAWAGEVCDAYPDRNVIITTHAYLDGKGYVMNENHSGSPHIKGGDTYGTTIWEELVSTHDNIVLAFSGHVTADKTMTRQEIGKYGQIVTQTVSNPQTIDDQSMLTGMVTMLYFSEDGKTMTVSDYSTIQEKFYGEPYTVTIDKAQHRHKPSTDEWSADLGSHWYACSCGEKANEAEHAFTAWELTDEDDVQQRFCVICDYTQTLTVPALFTEGEDHSASTHVWSYDESHHWLTCSCGEENVNMDEHRWTAWEKTGTASSEEGAEADLDVWERFCPCGASEYKALPMGMPEETNTEANLIYGKIDQNVGIGTNATTVTKTVAVDLKAGNRYALRFTAKGGVGKVELVGISGAAVTTVATENWRVYQYLFTPTADMTTLSLKFTRTGATRFDAVNIQILEAPQDGTFNLFPGADMTVENAVFATATAGLAAMYGGAATHVTDPTDPSNTVVQLAKNVSGYFQINNAFKGLKLNSDMYLEITFRRTGGATRLRKNWGANFPTYIGNQEAATASGVWETYTYYVAPGSADLIYQSGAWGTQHISFLAPNAVAYIDDIVIREVPRIESVSFGGGSVKVQASTKAQDLEDQLVITPPTACPLDLQNLTWSIANTTTNKWNPTDAKFNGTEFEAVTLTGTTIQIASQGQNGHMTEIWSLANVRPTITVTVSETVSVTAPIEWVYATEVFSWDIDNTLEMPQTTIDTYVTYENGESGNKVLSLPTSKDFTIFAKPEMFLEPNTCYLLTYRSKAVAGDTGRVYAYISNQTGIAPLNNPTGKALLESNNTTGDWIANGLLIQTGDAPANDRNYSVMFQRYGAGTNDVLVDDVKLVKVPDDYSLVLGGDFEFGAPTSAYYDKIIRGGFGTVEEEADGNHVLKLKAGVDRGTSTAIMAMGYLKKNSVYKVTFRYRGGAFLFNVAGGNGWACTINNVPLTKNLPAVSEWTEVECYFASSSSTTNSGNWSSMVQIGTPNATEDVYVDDIVFTEVKTAAAVQAVKDAAARPGSLTLAAGSESGLLLTTVTEGSTVRVTVKPNSGYMMVPGTLRYTTYDGATVKILNKSLSAQNFGKGDGMTYEFKMPAGAITLTADFVSKADTSVAFDTIGTSLRVEGEGYDGIRFLNRMYFGDGFDANFDTLTVRYGGAEYEIVEIGSLLKRSENATALTLANAEAALSLSGAERMWKSVAYTAGGNMSVVDYTGSYIDFSVVMLRGANVSEEVFNARSYTARGYMKLKAADGTVITVESASEMTNSVNTTAPLL